MTDRNYGEARGLEAGNSSRRPATLSRVSATRPADLYPNLDWKQTRHAGVELSFLETHDDGSARVLISMTAGSRYPAHRHVGEEQVFVIQGSYRDAAGEYRAGSFHRHPAGSAHAAEAGPDGALLLAWAAQGIEVLEQPPS